MTQEEIQILKQILLQDLAARLPYGVKIDKALYGATTLNERDIESFRKGYADILIPYLRPMSSMTDEERKELKVLCDEDLSEFAGFIKAGHGLSHDGLYMFEEMRQLEWLLKNHFDFRGLIPKGIALEAPEGLYTSKTE